METNKFFLRDRIYTFYFVMRMRKKWLHTQQIMMVKIYIDNENNG